MPTSAHGSDRLKPGEGTRRRVGARSRFERPGALRGFTLIELLIVLVIVALASAVATLALRDPQASALEREADRLSALFEAARAEARASGLPLVWVPAGGADAQAGNEGAPGFRFVGLPAAAGLPQHWLTPGVEAEVIGAKALILGPEPLIGAQRVALRLADRRLTLVTDGLGPFLPDHSDLQGPAGAAPGPRP